MRKLAFIIFCCLGSEVVRGQSLYFPPVSGSTWQTVSPASLGWCVSEIDSLYDFLEKGETKAFILLKDGKIAIEKYFGSFTQDSVWYWASAGKSLTAFLVGLAQQEGFLKIQDTSSKYLGTGWSSLTAAQESAITVRNHLSMTTGLDDGAGNPDCTLKSCLQYKADPGLRWAYHNAPYTLLDKVIEGATGKNLNSYASEKLKNATGITGLFIKLDYNNVFFSTARTMARFGLLTLAKGAWNGVKIMTDTGYFREMVSTSQNLNKSYGYLWWLNGKQSYMVPGLQLVIPGSIMDAAPDDMFSGLGKNGQYCNVVPSKNLVVIRMGNNPPQGGGLVPTAYNNNIWKILNKIMCSSNSIADFENTEAGFYPNPATDKIQFHETPHRVSIYSVSGVSLWSSEHCESVDLTEYKKGCYVVEYTQGNTIKRDFLVLE